MHSPHHTSFCACPILNGSRKNKCVELRIIASTDRNINGTETVYFLFFTVAVIALIFLYFFFDNVNCSVFASIFSEWFSGLPFVSSVWCILWASQRAVYLVALVLFVDLFVSRKLILCCCYTMNQRGGGAQPTTILFSLWLACRHQFYFILFYYFLCILLIINFI